jgi:hypothetical protein
MRSLFSRCNFLSRLNAQPCKGLFSGLTDLFGCYEHVGASPTVFSVMEKSVSDRRRSFPLLRKAPWFQKYCLDEENNRIDRKKPRSDSLEIVSTSNTSATKQRRSS